MFTTTSTTRHQRGVVSIFIVIFTALLVTVVTTSFVQIMLRNQQQASDNDLSQSAYDSAVAGVEDAKRALVLLKKCQRDSAQPNTDCSQLQTALSDTNQSCELLGDTRVNAATFNSNHEVQVGDPSLNQAYTCVKVTVQTNSYKGTFLNQGDTVVVPLLPVGDPNAMQAVRVSWYTADDLPTGEVKPTLPAGTALTPFANWAKVAGVIKGRPPVMRAQLMQFDKTQPITLSNFDGTSALTKFLFPLTGTRPKNDADSFTTDTRRGAISSNLMVYGGCGPVAGVVGSFDGSGYACSVNLSLPPMASPAAREAYLQLASIYNTGTVHYKVELLKDFSNTPNSLVNFDNVQPEVDSTGRASDLYRRVKARVTVTPSGSPLPFPDSPVSTKNLCKEFFITNAAGDYNGDGNGDGSVCTP